MQRIRTRLLHTDDAKLDVKYVPGGLLDIEFTAQTAILVHQIASRETGTTGMIEELSSANHVWKAHATELREIYRRLRRYEQMLKLASTHTLSALAKDDAIFRKASSLLGRTPDQAWDELRALARESRRILNDLDPTGLRIVNGPMKTHLQTTLATRLGAVLSKATTLPSASKVTKGPDLARAIS
ncbi:MAG: hypothetical protein HC902_01810 [Calothrix sp. SM1_5_4]|nr:hypothetical protein [Calothrix sp. SM1_5_4]